MMEERERLFNDDMERLTKLAEKNGIIIKRNRKWKSYLLLFIQECNFRFNQENFGEIKMNNELENKIGISEALAYEKEYKTLLEQVKGKSTSEKIDFLIPYIL